MEDAHFILLHKKIATKIEKGLTPRPQSSTQQHPTESALQVLEGSLWVVPQDELESRRKTVNLYSVEFESVILQNFPINSPEIQKLSKDYYDLLHAIPTCQDRFDVFRDATWMAEAVHITINSIVYLVNMPGFLEPRIPGRVRYKGPLPNENGTWFGVELSAEFRGKGTCDGNFKRKRFFTCHMESAVFKPINRLAFCGNPSEFKEAEEFDMPAVLNIPQALIPAPPPLRLGDRIVWISDTGPENGMVKWIGILPDARESNVEWMVGVEFDSNVGTGTGKYKDQQLFRAKQSHASLIPVMGLMKLEEYYGYPSTTTPPLHAANNNVSVPSYNTNESSLDKVDHGAMIPPDIQTMPREETGRPDEKYEPTVDSGPRPTMGKPYNSDTVTNSPVLVPMRYAEQYDSFPQNGNSTVVTNHSKSSQSVNTCGAEQASTQIEKHFDRFNIHGEGGHFTHTVHHSQPSQMTKPTHSDQRLVSTTNRHVHMKYQQNRYPIASASLPCTNLAPDRPEKQITDKDGSSIYDTHPYENTYMTGEQQNDANEGIYESTEPSYKRSVDSWEVIGELNGHQKYRSSGDVRSESQNSIVRDRFAAGSVDGLDSRSSSRAAPFMDSNSNMFVEEDPGISDVDMPVDMATVRRANYKHSNTDPQHFDRGDDFDLQSNEATSMGHHTAPGGTPVENFQYGGIQGNATMPLPQSHYPQHPNPEKDLTYIDLGRSSRSHKAKSVDDIIKRTDFKPMPRYIANSVFYQSVNQEDEINDEKHQHTLETGERQPSNGSTAKTQKNQRSSSTDELDSGVKYRAQPERKYETFKESMLHGRKEMNISKEDSFRTKEKRQPVEMTSAMANTELGIGSTVEVVGNPEEFRYGVIRWLGYMGDKNKPLVGLEMDVENKSCTDGTFGEFRLFECAPRKAFFVFLSKVRKDSRFEENPDFVERNPTLAFGSMECSDITGEVLSPNYNVKAQAYLGKNRGIQGHHNSCYMDATLFSMFSFSTIFDDLLKPDSGCKTTKEKVKLVLRECIVNPLRKHMYVRADKVMNLRVLLDEHSKVQGLTHAEKDPEEFLNSVLQDTLRAEPFIKLSSGLPSYLYQMIMEKDDQIILPTTQQLLGLSFLQSNLKLAEVPKRLILQMPRCGKKYKMYQRVVPSLTLDITDIIDRVPRECTICSHLATFECADCFKHFGDGSLLDISFCDECLSKSHKHAKRSSHSPIPLMLPQDMIDHYAHANSTSSGLELPRIKMDLFAVICIETSHYVAFVRAGKDKNSPWLFFDSMADRMGEQHGYNIPQVKLCRELPDWLRDEKRDDIIGCKENRDLPEHLRRVLCDAYICMYETTNSAVQDTAR